MNKIQKCIKENCSNLDLSGMNIYSLPKMIGQCTSLKTLDLSRNNLSKLPNEIENLINLHHIFLGYNKFTTFPTQLISLINLKTLSIKKNQLEEIPKEIKNLTNLELLSLSNNMLNTLPDTLGELINLKRISLFGNKFTSLPSQLGNLLNTQIDIDDARLLRDAFQKVPGSFKQSILLPNEIKVAFIQYLNFFEEYFSIINNKNVDIKVLSIVDGLEVEILPSESYSLDEVLKSLNSYMGYLKQNIETLKISEQQAINKNRMEIAILEKDLKNEIRILKMRIENKDFNIKVLQEANVTLMKALKITNQTQQTIQVINNIDNTNKQIIKKDPNIEKQLDKFAEQILNLKNLSRDEILENEVEKLLSIIQEVKSAKTKDELKSINFLNYANDFIRKIESETTALGKIFKSVKLSASIIIGLKDTLLGIFNSFSNFL